MVWLEEDGSGDGDEGGTVVRVAGRCGNREGTSVTHGFPRPRKDRNRGQQKPARAITHQALTPAWDC